ncbi:MAG: OB-fold nucleic acid binding domain-containing protein [Candidatus Krumholzibacteriota bacterium]
MRLLSACNKSLSKKRRQQHAMALLLLTAVLFSCAGKGISGHAGRNVIDGDVIIRGGGPLTRTVLLEDEHGIRTVVKSGKWRDELASLKGRRVKVRGYIEGSPRFGYSIEVKSYQLVPPAGMTAVRGVVNFIDGRLKLQDIRMGREFIIHGKLGAALKQLAGYEIWAWGREEKGIEEAASITVEGYELIGGG